MPESTASNLLGSNIAYAAHDAQDSVSDYSSSLEIPSQSSTTVTLSSDAYKSIAGGPFTSPDTSSSSTLPCSTLSTGKAERIHLTRRSRTINLLPPDVKMRSKAKSDVHADISIMALAAYERFGCKTEPADSAPVLAEARSRQNVQRQGSLGKAPKRKGIRASPNNNHPSATNAQLMVAHQELASQTSSDIPMSTAHAFDANLFCAFENRLESSHRISSSNSTHHESRARAMSKQSREAIAAPDGMHIQADFEALV